MQRIDQARNVLKFIWNHPANTGQQAKAISRAVAFQTRGRIGRRSQTTIGRHGRMWVDLHSTAASKALYANPPDWNEMQLWRRIIQPGDLFVDVGSNVGTYALWAADCGAEVIAVEPSPDAFGHLIENIALNDFPVVAHQCALAAQPGTMRLSQGKGTTNHIYLEPSELGIDVRVDTLDNLLGDRRVAGVKIDVEGAERLVLEGARRALAERRINILQLEWNELSIEVLGETRAPVAKLLEGYGYQIYSVDSSGCLSPVDTPEANADDLFAVVPGHPALAD